MGPAVRAELGRERWEGVVGMGNALENSIPKKKRS